MSKKEPRSATISITVTEAEHKKFVRYAKAEDRSISNYGYRVLRDYLKGLPELQGE